VHAFGTVKREELSELTFGGKRREGEWGSGHGFVEALGLVWFWSWEGTKWQ
jgi:hypothetical protein